MYSQVIDGVIGNPQSIPLSYENISGFNNLDDATLAQYGFYPYSSQVDTSNGDDVFDRSERVLSDNKVIETFYRRAYNQQELDLIQSQKADSVRSQRDQLLSESDYTQLPDVILSNKEDWVAYRQALRDVTLQEGFPSNVIWPVAPTN